MIVLPTMFLLAPEANETFTEADATALIGQDFRNYDGDISGVIDIAELLENGLLMIHVAAPD